MIKRIINFIKRTFKNIILYYKYYKESKEYLKSFIGDDEKIIWFIGSAHYDNIGDLAISESTINFLKDNFKNYKIIEIRLCDYYRYLRAMKKNIKANDIIVLQGGGNMGYKYFDAEQNRRSVINNFKNNQIIIFPSTIDYGNTKREKKEFKKSIYIYNKHKKLTICAREGKSYNIMKKIYRKVIFVPDIVLFNNFLFFNQKRKGICLCLRKDIEKSNLSEKVIKYFVDKTCQYTDNVSDIKKVEIDDRKKIVEDKMKEYASYELVITDRLHTMIFCYITKTPCLFLDNLNGKVLRVYNDWIKDSSCNYIKKLDINNIENEIKEFINIKPDNKAENIIKKCFEKLKECMED